MDTTCFFSKDKCTNGASLLKMQSVAGIPQREDARKVPYYCHCRDIGHITKTNKQPTNFDSREEGAYCKESSSPLVSFDVYQHKMRCKACKDQQAACFSLVRKVPAHKFLYQELLKLLLLKDKGSWLSEASGRRTTARNSKT